MLQLFTVKYNKIKLENEVLSNYLSQNLILIMYATQMVQRLGQ